MTDEPISFLFSYGTLRQPEVQQAVFGRELSAFADALPGFTLAWVEITDASVVAMSGSDRHPILKRSADPGDHVEGSALAIAAGDVAAADAYEVSDYRRIAVELASGRRAWAYVDQAHA